jgi:anti-anti-sigma factor
MDFQLNNENEIAVVKIISKKLTNTEAASFRDYFAANIKDEFKVAIDLSGLDYMDSAGLGAIISVNNELKEKAESFGKEFRLALFGFNKNIETILSIFKMDTVICLCPSKEEALAKF